MFSVPMTHHAATRLQQRGIPDKILPLLFEFGEEEYDHHGTITLFFNKRARQRLSKAVPQNEWKHIQGALNTYAVVDVDGCVVTVGHRTQRINHN